MRFGLVPHVAETARPWAKPTIIGPPVGLGHQVGSLVAQVDEKTKLGRGFRFFAELEDGDLEAIAAGKPIEFVVYAQQMVPVSIAVWR